MDLENVRVAKGVRNKVNRLVNCETANMNKAIDAALRQVEMIEAIKARGDFDKLPRALQQVANLRLQAPEASLKELGELCDPPIGKSGINHRMRRLTEFAKKMGLDGLD